jgi:dephospho-CoA kinase
MNSLKGITVIGLTGQSGSGKTTVCEVFEKCGFSVINADRIAREVTQPGTECLRVIEQAFPECIDEKTGRLDRIAMGRLVFTSSDMMLLYSSIIYPFITTKILSEIRQRAENGARLVLLDAPTLFESRADDFCNYIVSVIADEKLRFERIVERDNISTEAIRLRFESQKDDEYYISRSDAVIFNNGGISDFIENANKTARKIKELFDEKGC